MSDFSNQQKRQGRKEVEPMALEIIPWRRPGALRSFWPDVEDFWNRFFADVPMTERGFSWSPSVDISETDGNVTVKAELPGMDAKDIDIDVTGDMLTIRGEKKMEKEKKEERYYFRERHYGSFRRSFQLPAAVQSDKVDAEFKGGVLTISLPKSEKTKQKKIQIKTS
jgi:HSP20 family protein